MRKIMMAAFGAAALAAAAVPAAAPAEWTHNHAALQSNAPFQPTGQLRLQTQGGSIECQVVMDAQLTAGTTTAHTQFKVDLQGTQTVTDDCNVGGGLAVLGCTDVGAVSVSGLPWTVHAAGKQTLAVTTNTLEFGLHGSAFCPTSVDFTPGTLHLTTPTQNTWTTAQWSQQLQAMRPGGIQENATASGHMEITPSGTYGVV